MSLIGRFEHLPNRPRSNEARPLLEKIASQVKPVMTKRGWKVGTLAEFIPSDPSLLGNNMNRGQRINLRLRPPGDNSTFYEFDQLVLVMLHELTHIVHGPHDASFYKLLAELEEEFYELKRKGYEGEGFHSAGNRLHGVRVNEYEGRRRGLAAAERRLAIQKKLGKGGVLGGSVRNAGKTMREIVAEAAERRIKDDKACNTASAAEVEAEVKRAQEESVGINAEDISPVGDTPEPEPGLAATAPPVAVPQSNSEKSTSERHKKRSEPDIIDLTGESPPRIRKASQTGRSPPKEVPNAHTRPPADKGSAKQPPPKEWSCSTCTLLNPLTSPTCEACTSPRPRISSSAGWFCDFCGAGPRGLDFWSCGECGWVRKWG